MTPSQKRLRELKNRQSTERQRMAELSLEDTLTTETRAELDTIEKSTPDLERQIRAAVTVCETEDRAATLDAADKPADTDRAELRAACSLTRYMLGAGGTQRGAEAELQAELGLNSNEIPLEMFTESRAEDAPEKRTTPTPAPSTVGVNLDTLRPAVFAPSVADRLMLEMPNVESGTYATATINTSLIAGAVPKGGTGTTGDVPEQAAAFEATTTTPHRIGGSLLLSVEDIAAVGAQNFESILRQNISLVLSAELDDQLLNGDGSSNDLIGFFERIGTTSLTTPGAVVADFDDFVAGFVAGIDGLWATMSDHVGIVAGVDTYKIAAAAFRDFIINVAQRGGVGLGDVAFTDYAAAHYGGFWTNSRMPDAPASNLQAGILTRRGQSMMPQPMRTAVAPHWGYLSIDDIYTGARKGQRRYVLSVLVGDVILVQPKAYDLVTFRTAT